MNPDSRALSIEIKKLIIPTYTSPAPVDLPVFCENRNHQRTSGRVYPNKIVNTVDRSSPKDKEYTVVTLENEYVKIEILPEIGGRIYSALDKTTGYDFFYKQHVIKPALIGVLGSWISGGIEFNWPFHHRASGFIPCDFTVEESEDEVICWLSEHDPIDRMKGMVGIVLRRDKKYFETRVRLYNRTESRKSFLWWENAAVPVNEDYQIFFPQDVRYVSFHYLNSRTTYPVSGGTIYNGNVMKEERDISMHKNTRRATSYFSGASKFDFFGGYDHGKDCGVVHVANHHISPGKKMFTWGYSELSKVWENALTDTDGQYAELMAGSYSDNQPNFSWIEPYETKQFSEYWYPISQTGTLSFANLNAAISVKRAGGSGIIKITPTANYKDALITVETDGKQIVSEKTDLVPTKVHEIHIDDIPEYVRIIINANEKCIADYTEKNYDYITVPPTFDGLPSTEKLKTTQELYLAGIHVKQYRDPAIMPDAYFKAALQKDPDHLPSLIAMAEYELERYSLESAERYAEKAVRVATRFNDRPESGSAYFILARVLEAEEKFDEAYDTYFKAYYSADCVSKAMTRIASLDLRKGEFESALAHSENALEYMKNNSTAKAIRILSLKNLGRNEEADNAAEEALIHDPLDHFIRFLSHKEDFYDRLDSNPEQTCLDIAYDLGSMGRYEEAIRILEGLGKHRPESLRKPGLYALGYFNQQIGNDPEEYYKKASESILGPTFFFRLPEAKVLEDAIKTSDSDDARYHLGCLLYNFRHYYEAAELWKNCRNDIFAKRNLAVAAFSHLSDETEAKRLILEALEGSDNEKQLTKDFLLFDAAHLMEESNTDPNEIINLILSRGFYIDNVATELAKAYNYAEMPDKALETIINQHYVACEGGEHAIADQYLIAYFQKGMKEFREGRYEEAFRYLEEGQDIPISIGAGVW
ncbi:MAG: DUF5107 domain-containing protein, partial [Clostridia bacterium]|nr:DUF5107 domain-containing protein [Clostridia bacterium]